MLAAHRLTSGLHASASKASRPTITSWCRSRASSSPGQQRQPFSSPGQAPGRRDILSAGAAALAGAAFLPRRGLAIMAAAAGGQHDLLIVGPGVLGSYAGKLWKESFTDSTVVGQTNSTANHDRLKQLGITPRTKAESDPGQKFPNVLFCAPPSGSVDYPAEVRAATKLWDGTGSFVFTSSGSVCVPDSNSVVTEECQTVPMGAGPSTDKLLAAEQAVTEAGGNVVRLVGLYHKNRGAHTFFIKQGTVARPGSYIVNLIHYEDAASLAVAILRGDGSSNQQPYRGRTFLGCDNTPVTFQDMMDACFESGLFSGSVTFTGAPDSAGPKKLSNNGVTRRALGGWAPKYSSFKEFCNSGGNDFYTSSGLF